MRKQIILILLLVGFNCFGSTIKLGSDYGITTISDAIAKKIITEKSKKLKVSGTLIVDTEKIRKENCSFAQNSRSLGALAK